MIKLVFFLALCVYTDSIHGQGCTRGNCVNGFGSYKYHDGSRYTGEFKQGKKHGKGIYYYTSQNKYMGEWLNDLKEGEGKLSFFNGDVYTGNFKADKIEGQGNMDFKSGDRFTGNWRGGKPNGIGTYYFVSGERYEGHLKDARLEGEGSLYYKSGSFYKGNWKASLKDGYGEYRDVSGKTIVAQWKNDKLIRIYDDSTLEELKISSKPELAKPKEKMTNVELAKQQQSEPTNSVTATMEINKISKPRQEDSNIHINGITLPNCNAIFCSKGKGIFTYGDGSKYIGEFFEGEPKGRGVCYYMNGDRYEGMWAHHAPHGEGIMYFISGLTYGALWNHGKSVKELQKNTEFVFDKNIPVDSNPEVKIWAVIIGIARYEHMPSLKYSDDDAYKIYAFLKSPEGGALKDNQIRILIDEEATRVNILQALNQTFMRADENDVIMMYFSGHGLEGTFIPIDYDGFSNLLKHDDVKEILNRSKARHKVCYTDACHSGSLLATKGAYSNSLLYFYEEFDKANGGTAFFMSSKSKEFSMEDGGLRQGIFSHFLIKGLKGLADENSNKIITLKELFNYVYTNVRQYTSNVQTPMIAGDYDESMPVGFVRTD